MEKQLEFPIDIYPPPLRHIIEDTHRDLNFPVNYIAASLLLAVSVAVGNSRVLKVCDGWRVKPILYMALVGSPGSVKTHPVSFALAPFRRSDDYTLGKYAADLTIGLIASGQEKKSEEQDFAPNKKRGPRL